MDYAIHTFGGGEILWHVLNGISNVFHSNNEYFTPVGKFAFTIGAIWAGGRALFKGNLAIFALDWMIPSFLVFALLFSPKATMWVHDEVSGYKSKVDNIPFGIAFFSSLSSRITYALTKTVEDNLQTVGSISSQGGIMFGAKAIGKIREIKIQNPTTLSNTKLFMKQCFLKPYVMANILNKKTEAMQTKDILGFIGANIPNNFGMYYRDDGNNNISFKTCNEALGLISTKISQELTINNSNILSRFAAAIGLAARDKRQLNSRLKAVTGDTLRALGRDQTDVHQWMKQAMLLNASREGYDDWREGFNLKRIYPGLVSMNATRGLFQQSFGWIIAGEMAADMLPLLQNILFSLIICSIFIVFPVSLLPGGLKTLTTWIKLIIWVNTWPVFFAIVHSIGMKVLEIRMDGISGDYGMSMISQGGFSEMMLNTYAVVQLFASSVPVLSWFVLTMSGHALAQLTERAAALSTAAGLGSATVDGNLNMDNISVGNRSMHQQQLGPNVSMGSSYSDGINKYNMDGSGQQVYHEGMSNLRTNYNAADMVSNVASDQLSKTDGNIKSDQVTQHNLATKIENDSHGLAAAITSGKATVHGLSAVDSKTLTEAYNKGWLNTEGISESSTKGEGTQANAGLKTPLVTAGVGVNANNSHNLSKNMTAAEQDNLTKALSSARQAIKTGNYSTNDTDTNTMLDSHQKSLTQQESIAQNISSLQQQSSAYQEMISYAQSNQNTINSNLNDPILEQTIRDYGAEHGLSNKEQANAFLNNHGAEANQVMAKVIQDKGLHNITHVNKPDSLNSNIPSVTSSDNLVSSYNSSKAGHQQEMDARSQAILNEQEQFKEQNTAVNNQVNDGITQGGSSITDQQQQLIANYESAPDSTAKRAAQEALKNAGLDVDSVKNRNLKLPK